MKFRWLCLLVGLLMLAYACYGQDQQYMTYGPLVNALVLTQPPVTWTAQSQNYALYVEVPKAHDCSYWGAIEVKGKCTGDLVFNSEPKNLKCHLLSNGMAIVRCVWDKPK